MDEALQDWSRALQEAFVDGNSALPALHAVFGVLSTPTASEDSYEDFRREGPSLMKKTIETLTLLVGSLPADQFFVPLIRCIKQGFKSGDPHTRRAAVLAALAACIPDHQLTQVYWKPLLPTVLKGMVDPCSFVQSAALFAFERFGQLLLKDDILLSADARVANALLCCLGRLSETWTKQNGNVIIPPHFMIVFAVFGDICGQCLRISKGPLHVRLLDCLLQIFDSKYPDSVRRLALTALNRVVKKIDLSFHIDQFIQAMHKRVKGELGKEALPLQLALIRYVNSQNCPLSRFGLVTNIVNLVSSTLEIVDSRRSMREICVLLGCLHEYFISEVEALLHHLVTTNLEILRQADEEKTPAVRASGVAADHTRESSSDDYIPPNKFTEPKERACIVLLSIAHNVDLKKFRPYFHACYEQLCETVYHPEDRVRSAALESLSSICCVFWHHPNPNHSKTLLGAMRRIVPECVKAITSETNDDVIFAGLRGLRNFMESDFHLSRDMSTLRVIIDTIVMILSSKTQYQGGGNYRKEIEDREDNEKSLKFAMFDFCFQFISNAVIFDEAMTDDMFGDIFGILFPFLMSKTKQHCSDTKKTVALNTLGTCIKRLAEDAALYIPEILPTLLRYVYWSEDPVREKSLLALAKFICYGGKALSSYYSEIIKLMNIIAGCEKESRFLDLICIAISGMICTDVSLVPLDRILPTYFAVLPHKLNFYLSEYKHVIHCLVLLYKLGHPLLKDHISVAIEIAYSAGASGSVFSEQETINDAAKLIRLIKQDFLDVYESTIEKIPKSTSEWVHSQLNL